MKTDSVIEILLLKYGSTAKAGRKNECPFCKRKTFAVKRDDTIARCFHPECRRFVTPRSEAPIFSNLIRDTLEIVLEQMRPVLQANEGKAALEYLINERRIHPAVIRGASIGIVPFNFDVDAAFAKARERAEGNAAVIDALQQAAENLKRLLYPGNIAQFYRDDKHRCTAIKFRKPNTKNFILFKPLPELGVFGAEMFPVETTEDTYLIVVEGEFNQFAIQSVCAWNAEAHGKEPEQGFVYCAAVGGVDGADIRTVISLSKKFVVNPDRDTAGAALVENLREYTDVEAFEMPEPAKDADEYLRSFSDHAAAYTGFRALLQKREHLPFKAKEGDADPHRLARVMLKEKYEHEHGSTLINYRGQFNAWNGASYRTVSDDEMKPRAAAAVKREFDRIHKERRQQAFRKGQPDLEEKPTAQVSNTLNNNVLLATASETCIDSAIQSPAWINTNCKWPADEILAAPNGLFHLPSLAAGLPASLPTTPRFFTFNALSFPVNLTAAAPRRWLEFLEQLWHNDPESRELLQEWFGYLLTADTSQQKILFGIGPKRSGKGTIGRVMTGLLGQGNCSSPTLGSLAGEFGMWPLLDKLLAIIPDARLSGRVDQTAIVERLLSISGEDSLSVNRKHLAIVTTQLKTRIVMFTNEIPRLGENSMALASRFLVLKFTKSFYDHEDHGLSGALLEELPGILLWAVDGWRRLRDRGHFKQPESGREIVRQFEELSSPISAFVREHCEVKPEHVTPKSELYGAWKSWSEGEGRQNAGDVATFGRNLTAAFPIIKTMQKRFNGQRTWCYVGIGFSTDAGTGLAQVGTGSTQERGYEINENGSES